MTNEKGETISMKIFDTEFEKNTEKIAIGTIFSDQKKELKIAVSDGFIKILSLQMSGKRKISTDEFLRGYNVKYWKLMV